MIFLIHSLEIALILLVVLLGYRIIKRYQAEYETLPTAVSHAAPDVIQSDECIQDKADGKSIVEAYINDFFPAECEKPIEHLNVLHVDQQQNAPTISSDELAVKSKAEGNDRSISNKVIEAMMAEADLACAS